MSLAKRNIEELSAPDLAALCDLETEIERGIQSFITVGTSLQTIRKRRLYRNTDKTFEAYCQRRWKFTRQRAHQLIVAAGVAEELPEVPQAAARELAKAPAGKRAETWAEAVASAPKDDAGEPKVTAAVVRNAVAGPNGNGSPPKDDRGTKIEKNRVAKAFACAALFAEAEGLHRQLLRKVDEIANSDGGAFLDLDEFKSRAKEAKDCWLLCARPYVVCPLCSGDGCKACRKTGYLPKFHFDSVVPEELKT